MATTTNYSWTTPDDTDLVKDGASAIRSLGTAIDSTVFTNAGNAVQKSTIDAKADLLVGTADNTVGRLAVGTNEHRLVADSGETTGLKYVADTTNYAVAAKGDLLVGTAADTVAALSVGTNGHILVADSAETTGLKWQAPAGAASFAGVRLTNSTNISATNVTETLITFNGETFDTDGFHSTVTNTGRITIPAGKGGKYSIFATVGFANNSTGRRLILVKKNGNYYYEVEYEPVSGAASSKFYGGTLMDLAVGDYVEVYGFQSSGGALNLTANECYLEATFLGA